MTIASLKHPLKILQLDSDAATAKKIIQELSAEGIKANVDEISSRKQLISHLQNNAYDLIFLADNPQDCSGVDALKAIKKLKVYTPILIFSDILDEETIVNYITLGATDYLLKSSLHRMVPVVKRIISNTRNSKIVDYQNFFETSPDLLCICDKEGHFSGINPSWGRIFGFTDAELIDKPFIQFVHPEDQKSAAAQFQKLFDEKNKTADMVCRFLTAAEDIRWLHWKMKIQSNGCINVIARDVTETKAREVQISQAHQNLQKLVELYKADIVKKTLIADQIRDSVVVTDLKGLIVSWNKGSEKVFGYSPEEAVGQHIALIYPEKDYKYIQEEATNVLLEQGSKEFELNMRRKNGEVFEARLTLEVTRDNEDKVNGMLGYAIDMGPVRENTDTESDEQQSLTDIAAQELVVQKDKELHVDEHQPVEKTDVLAVENAQDTSGPLQSNVTTHVAPVKEPEVSNETEQTASTMIVAVVPEQEEQTKAEQLNEEHESVPEDQAKAEKLSEEQKNKPEAEQPVEQEVVEISVVSSEVSLMYLEDSIKNINAVEEILVQRPDYRLITTQEPEDCVDMARQYAPTLILLDIDHSEVDGFELLKQLRQEEKLQNIPVIAVGIDSSSEKIQTARTAGFADYLVKPLESKNFLDVIDSLLGKPEPGVLDKVGSV